MIREIRKYCTSNYQYPSAISPARLNQEKLVVGLAWNPNKVENGIKLCHVGKNWSLLCSYMILLWVYMFKLCNNFRVWQPYENNVKYTNYRWWSRTPSHAVNQYIPLCFLAKHRCNLHS